MSLRIIGGAPLNSDELGLLAQIAKLAENLHRHCVTVALVNSGNQKTYGTNRDRVRQMATGWCTCEQIANAVGLTKKQVFGVVNAEDAGFEIGRQGGNKVYRVRATEAASV